MSGINPYVAIAIAALVGLFIGSFLNVVIHRLPKMLERGWAEQCAELRGEESPKVPLYNLAVPRSQCPACGHQITALENVPIASFLALGGKCSSCGKPISARYPLVEALGGVLAAAAIWRFGATWQGLAACVLLWTLVALTFIDFDTQLLPDGLTLPLLWGGLIVLISPRRHEDHEERYASSRRRPGPTKPPLLRLGVDPGFRGTFA